MDPTNDRQAVVSVQRLRELYPVALAFILHHLVLAIACIGLPYSVFHPFDFVRSDSALYLDIAKNGYELFRCHERFEAYAATDMTWCGNAGWMPLYGWILRPFIYLGVDQYLAAFCLSRLCYFIVLFFIYRLSASLSPRARVAVLMTAAVFPSAIYYSAAFPISLMMMMMLGSLYFWQKKLTIPAMICGFLIPLSYSTGFVNIAVWAIFSAVVCLRQREAFVPAVLVTCSALVGYGVFFLVQHLTTGHWNAFFLIQEKYGHGIHDIFQPLGDMVKSIWLSGINHNWQNIQSLIFIVLIPVVLAASLKEKNNPLLFVNICFVLFAAFPVLIGSGQLAQYRAESLLLPVVIFLGQRKKLLLVMIPVFLYLTLSCTIEFFMGQLS